MYKPLFLSVIIFALPITVVQGFGSIPDPSDIKKEVETKAKDAGTHDIDKVKENASDALDNSDAAHDPNKNSEHHSNDAPDIDKIKNNAEDEMKSRANDVLGEGSNEWGQYKVERGAEQGASSTVRSQDLYNQSPNRYRLNNTELNRVSPYDSNQYNNNYRSNRDPYTRKHRLPR